MRMLKLTMLAAFAAVLPALGAMADMDAKPGNATAGDWTKRMPVTPNPDKVVVPPGYKVGGFKAGPGTPSPAARGQDGQGWVAHFRPLFHHPCTPGTAHLTIFA